MHMKWHFPSALVPHCLLSNRKYMRMSLGSKHHTLSASGGHSLGKALAFCLHMSQKMLLQLSQSVSVSCVMVKYYPALW